MAYPLPYLDAGVDDTTAVTYLQEPTVSMDEGLSAYIHTMRSQTPPVRLILVVAHRARLTPAFDRLVDAAGCAVLVEEQHDGYRTLRSGRWTPSVREFATHGPLVRDASTVPGPHYLLETRVPLLSLSISLFHPARRSTSLGRCAELVVEHLMPEGTELSWGRYEPAGAIWDRNALTALARKHMPEVHFMLAAHGPDGSVMSGTLTVARTSNGLEEYLELVLNPRWLPLGQWTDQCMSAFTAIGNELKPQFLLAHRPFGYPDGTLPASTRPLTTPLAVLIGAPGLKQLGIDAAELVQRHGGTVTGRGRRHGALIPLGTSPESSWRALTALLITLDGTDGNLARVLSPSAPEG